MATPAQEACGNAMLRRSTYLLIVAVIGLLTWTAATDLTAKLLILLMSGTLPRLSALTGGSETLAIILVAGTVTVAPALLVWTVQRMRIRKLATSPEHYGCWPIRGFEAAWARFAAMFGLSETDRPRQVFACDASVLGGDGVIAGGMLRLSYDVADRLRLGRGRRPEAYDGASLILLHELAHLRSGDAHLSVPRDAIAVTGAVLAGFGFALVSGRTLQPMFLVEVTGLTVLTSATLLSLLRQVSRQIEYAADAWAVRAIASVHGDVAAAAAIDVVGTRLVPDATEEAGAGRTPLHQSRHPRALEHHPNATRRLTAMRSRSAAWPLVLLWMAMLVTLVWVQSARTDLACHDCGQYYQTWFAVLAWAIAILLSIVVFRLRRAGWSPGRDFPFLARFAVTLAVWLVYVGARCWVAWDTLVMIWHTYTPTLAVGWIFMSNDDYTLASTVHLIVATAILLWPLQARPAYSGETEVTATGTPALARISVRCIVQEAEIIAVAFGRGVSLCLITAGAVMLTGPLLNGNIQPALPAWWAFVAGTSSMIIAGWLAAFRLPTNRRRAAAVLGAEAVVLLALVAALDFAQRLQLAYMAQHGMDPSLPQYQMMVGALMLQNFPAFWTPDLRAQAVSGWPWDVLLIGITLTILAALRLRHRPMAAGHGG